MNQINVIQCQVLDQLLKPILRDNNETPVQKKSLLIKFNSAKISNVVIKLNQKPKNIVAYLNNPSSQSSKPNQQQLEYIKFNFFSSENQKIIYNSLVNTEQFYTCLQIKIEEEGVAFYNIQLYGQEAQKQKQSTLDNFILKPQQMDNETGTFRNFTDALQSNRDPAGREKKRVNKIALKQKLEIEEAVEESLISAKYEELNQKLIQESINNANSLQQQQGHQFDDDQDVSLEILMGGDDLQQFKYEQKNQPKINVENLGYTDNKIKSNQDGNKDTNEIKGQQYGYHQQWKNDQIKLHLMTKYKAKDINQAFMQRHKLMEQSNRVRSFLENVMYN